MRPYLSSWSVGRAMKSAGKDRSRAESGPGGIFPRLSGARSERGEEVVGAVGVEHVVSGPSQARRSWRMP